MSIAYKPCADCRSGKHRVLCTVKEVTAVVEDRNGQRSVVKIPGQTTYLRVGAMCYIPTLSDPDQIPEGHKKTLAELWDEHGLFVLEWAVPYG